MRFRKKEGKEKVNVRINEKTEVAAQFLEDVFWEKREEKAEDTTSNEQIVEEKLEYNTGKITAEEVGKI